MMGAGGTNLAGTTAAASTPTASGRLPSGASFFAGVVVAAVASAAAAASASTFAASPPPSRPPAVVLHACLKHFSPPLAVAHGEGGRGDGAPAAVVAALLCGAACGLGSRLGRGGSSSPRWRRGQSRPQISSLAAVEPKDGDSAAVSWTHTVLLPQTEFSQRSNATKREPELQAFWQKEGIYEALQERPAANGTFSLHDGPPYANGALHMGHALNKILKDSINKFKMAQGYKVKFIPGWDCHGLPIELKVLQSLKSKERKDLTPLKLRQVAEKFAKDTVQEQRLAFERFGVWGDFDDPYLTLLPKYEAAQLGIFEDMVRGGQIYRGRKPVYWSPSTRTALAESELEYPEGHTSQSIYVGFRCTGEVPASVTEIVGDASGLEVAVWTTTPWTIPANRAVAVNPELEYVVARAEMPDGRTRRLVVASGLVESLQATLEMASMSVESRFLGVKLEGLRYEHPLTGTVAPVVLGGDYITTESGTGLVHTAPGHGVDDYKVGLKYGLEVAAPVDNAGNFTEEVGVESLVGANVLKDANDRVIALLKESGHLLLEKPYVHKYPYDWRSKKPVITRATPQWFASIDGIRDDALAAIDKVRFVPESYANRMRPMIVGRSDWCISRQRSWGVPIPAFYRKGDEAGEPLLNPEVISHVRGIVAEKGTNAWFEMSVEDLLPDAYKADAELYEKGKDTMDVWFDSGSSWAYVQEELGSPVDLYLEGQDQHRGWFQSSLITSVAVRGEAPYKTVLTHGFCVDGNGRKMSKSIGNVIDPFSIILGGKNPKKEPAYGADVLRLWVASVDFTFDVAISQEIMGNVADNVKKLRNRARFMLGNIYDFDPAKDAIAYSDLPLLDRHVIHGAEEVFEQMTEMYDSYNFSQAMKLLTNFTQDLSSFYLDVAKDRLYIEKADSARRRSCQTVLRWLTERVARVISPVLTHLAEDIYQSLPGAKAEKSIFLTTWYEPFPGRAEAQDDELIADFRRVLDLRDPTNLALEKARRSELLGSSLEASVSVRLQPGSPLRQCLDCLAASPMPSVDSLAFLLGVSAATVGDDAAAVEDGDDKLGATVTVERAAGFRCHRCRMYFDSVDSNTLCGRCSAVVEALGVSALQAAHY